MPKKSAKKVKAKKSKRPPMTREVASRAPAKKRHAVAKPAAKKAAKPARKKAAKPAAKKAAKPAGKKAAKPAGKKAEITKKPAAKKATQTHASARPEIHIRRRDGSGHLDPKYAADLLRQSGRPELDGVGFLAQSRSNDDLAESFGEQFVEGATTGEGPAEDELDQEVPEERGGPFIRSNAGTEFAEGTDRSNPKGAKREPFPTT